MISLEHVTQYGHTAGIEGDTDLRPRGKKFKKLLYFTNIKKMFTLEFYWCSSNAY